MSAWGITERDLLDRRYRLLTVVGHGGKGRVYKAVHVGLDATVALWELRAPAGTSRAAYDAARSALFGEARRLTSLCHPNLPRVHDYFSHGDACFLVMEYVEGESLADRLRRQGRVPFPVFLDYGLQLCDALAYLHRRVPPIFIGSLTPSNVVLTQDGPAIVSDFGLARRFALHIDFARDAAPMNPGGSAAPERHLSAALDVRSDIQGLGAVLYELASGRVPSSMSDDDVSLHKLGPHIPETLHAILARALRSDPGRGLASAEELGQALRTAARDVLPPSSPVAIGQTAATGFVSTDLDTAGRSAQTQPLAMRRGMRSPTSPTNVASQARRAREFAASVAPSPDDEVRVTPAGGSDAHHAPTAPRPRSIVSAGGPSEQRWHRTPRAAAAGCLALAALLALALAMSLLPGPSSTASIGEPPAGAIRSNGGQTPPPLAGSHLGGPPAKANPPAYQPVSRRAPVNPPTPTPRPTSTPTLTATPTVTSTATPVPSPTQIATPSPTTTPAPDPFGTPGADGSGTPGADASPTSDPNAAPTPEPTDAPSDGLTPVPLLLRANALPPQQNASARMPVPALSPLVSAQGMQLPFATPPDESGFPFAPLTPADWNPPTMSHGLASARQAIYNRGRSIGGTASSAGT